MWMLTDNLLYIEVKSLVWVHFGSHVNIFWNTMLIVYVDLKVAPNLGKEGLEKMRGCYLFSY